MEEFQEEVGGGGDSNGKLLQRGKDKRDTLKF